MKWSQEASSDSHLRTHPKDAALHSQRRIFVVIDGNVEVAPAGTALSHLEWCEKEGWCSSGNREEFMERSCRGMYLSSSNTLYAYQGNGFFIHPDTRTILLAAIPKLKEELGLNDLAEVWLGPKDEVVHGVRYKRVRLGKLSELT